MHFGRFMHRLVPYALSLFFFSQEYQFEVALRYLIDGSYFITTKYLLGDNNTSGNELEYTPYTECARTLNTNWQACFVNFTYLACLEYGRIKTTSLWRWDTFYMKSSLKLSEALKLTMALQSGVKLQRVVWLHGCYKAIVTFIQWTFIDLWVDNMKLEKILLISTIS